MLYELHELEWWFPPLRMFRYITFRAVGGAGTAFLLTLLAGPWIIAMLKRFRIAQVFRKEEAPSLYKLHEEKEGTPTMGGVMVILAVLLSGALWCMPGNTYVGLALATMVYMGAVGFWDDYRKLVYRNSRGLPGRAKLLLQVVWGLVLTLVLLVLPETRDRTCEIMVPFFKQSLVANVNAWTAAAFITLIIAGSTNAVNLTDGLDGLAIGCSSTVAFSYLVMAYVAGHYAFADYLQVPFVRGAGELAVLCGCLMGACLGFLWFNCHPAKVFMGDTGSLALGGIIAVIAILVKQELVLVIVGGVFVMEALSVMIQVGSFRLRGRRVFAMAPIHHHFEHKGWSETQVTIRFWVISIIFALLGLLTLKIR
ncbi:MAG: phospho-N-acetylmuramoyl-pentapeptide-transferase [Lentisphaerae bacterium RIFOXYC12_FULL_60_16]|nr:MAG: phospho-N-acetylmuramoyl-pentapeptide-transferase [Lentisphaerae bacterium RIFOXYC12_FULL_60_16]OGV86473.1 MAG: phospho-N-acetylmuramoyl-pentapeptide-transferase [Lentisphaerae bacterium RIFOXYB12_FULL_60_10]